LDGRLAALAGARIDAGDRLAHVDVSRRSDVP
jgi:hypothetical protein